MGQMVKVAPTWNSSEATQLNSSSPTATTPVFTRGIEFTKWRACNNYRDSAASAG